mmetsp:Transcript_35881/g.55193  ORF Transcript_35881/g.55193 Transcript_35881/m.55193 type:complete len:112 (-) Transcript_35881:4-339(-)
MSEQRCCYCSFIRGGPMRKEGNIVLFEFLVKKLCPSWPFSSSWGIDTRSCHCDALGYWCRISLKQVSKQGNLLCDRKLFVVFDLGSLEDFLHFLVQRNPRNRQNVKLNNSM